MREFAFKVGCFHTRMQPFQRTRQQIKPFEGQTDDLYWRNKLYARIRSIIERCFWTQKRRPQKAGVPSVKQSFLPDSASKATTLNPLL